MSTIRASLGAVALSIGLFGSAAVAQDLSASISCLRGTVPAADYSELDQSVKESIWDSRAGVTLVSEVGGVRLLVMDLYGTSVCDQEASNSTTCKFKLNARLPDVFTIKVDNVEGQTKSDFKLCAF